MSDSAEKNSGFDRSSVHRKGTSPVSTGDARRSAPPPPATRRPRLSLVLKLLLLVGLTVALLVGVLVTTAGPYWRKALRAQIEAQLGAIANDRRGIVQTQVALLRQRATFHTDHGEFRGYYSELIANRPPSVNRDLSQALLERFSDGRPIVAASLVNSAGKVLLATVPAEVGRDLSAEPEFKAGMAGSQVGQPRWVGGRFEAVVTAPVYSGPDSHRVYGVLRLVADISDLATALRDSAGLGETGETILGVRNGGQFEFLLPPRHAPATAGAAPAQASESATAFATGLDDRGVPVLAAGRSVGYGGWVLIAKMDESEVYAPLFHFQRSCVLAGLMVAVASLAAAYALALSFARPLRRLAQGASSVIGGDYETVVPVKSTDEFGALSATFNEMVTSIRERRRDRDQTEESLRETDQRKNEFLAMLGHELRNPLAAIVHAVRLEQDSADDPDASDLARSVIVRQTDHLTRLVDDLLDVARITQGKIELRRSPVEVRDIVKRAVDAVRPQIEERHHQFDLILSSGGKWRVDADPTRLEQIVTNLLANAVKYTPDGGRITLVERHEGRDSVITVSDNGIGIAPEMLPQIFELFTQADHSLDRTSGGLGIGLSLCRQLVELHGGTISAHSNGVGKGAAFTVRLPAMTMPQLNSPAPSSHGPARHTANHPRRRILLVDDNQDTVHALSRLLAARGHEVATAFDGLTALQMAHDFKPDVLLLDLGLPGLDGYELARRLRAGGFQHAPIIAISGYAQEGDRARSRAAGFTYHFAKPVDFEALAELIIEEPLAID